jgi:hypothetical protein
VPTIDQTVLMIGALGAVNVVAALVALVTPWDRCTECQHCRLAAAEREAGELRLRPGVVASVGTAHDLRLVLEVPPGVPAVVVVRSPDARRELRQTVVAPAGEARVDVPAAWLSPGEHVVIVEAGGRETSPLRFIVTPR